MPSLAPLVLSTLLLSGTLTGCPASSNDPVSPNSDATTTADGTSIEDGTSGAGDLPIDLAQDLASTDAPTAGETVDGHDGGVDAAPDADAPTGPQPQFLESDGYLVMEMESVAIGALDWVEENELDGGNGSYYRFLGNNICSGPASDPLHYSFRLKSAGIWEMRLFMARIWHCVEGLRHDADNHVCQEGPGIKRGCEHLGVPDGELCGEANGEALCLRKDLSNDVFVRIETADGTFVPYTERTTDEEQVKLFGGGQNAFSWSGAKALDPTGAKRHARWDLPAGDYRLTVFGRSQGTRVDRLLLFHETASFNEGKAQTETLFER